MIHSRALTASKILRKWRLQNFKSIRQADLELGPLTIVVGPNSSGKSTLIQSILLAVQAAQARQVGETFPLNGPLVSLGSFDDVLSFGASDQSISIGGSFFY